MSDKFNGECVMTRVSDGIRIDRADQYVQISKKLVDQLLSKPTPSSYITTSEYGMVLHITGTNRMACYLIGEYRSDADSFEAEIFKPE